MYTSIIFMISIYLRTFWKSGLENHKIVSKLVEEDDCVREWVIAKNLSALLIGS